MLLDQFLPPNRIGPCVVCGTLTLPEAAALLDSDPATYTFVNAHNIHDIESYAGFGHVVFDLTDQMDVSTRARATRTTRKMSISTTRASRIRT